MGKMEFIEGENGEKLDLPKAKTKFWKIGKG